MSEHVRTSMLSTVNFYIASYVLSLYIVEAINYSMKEGTVILF